MGVAVKQEACDIFHLAIELLTLKVGYEFTRDGYTTQYSLLKRIYCLQAVNLITSGEPCFTADGVIVVEIGQHFIFIHKPRECNVVALKIARFSVRGIGLFFWLEDIWVVDNIGMELIENTRRATVP